MGQPKVSIVIPFYNCPYVDQAVVSALSQTYAKLEVIVVDDGSTLHRERLLPYLGSIRYIGKANGGTASALNCGIQAASGEYVAWLSSDDLFYPGKIERQVGYMERHSAAICHTDFNVIDERGTVVQADMAARFSSAKEFIAAFQTYCPVNGCTVMMRKDFALDIGLFNEGLTYTHDYDLWLRTHLCRVDFHFIPETLTAYRRHTQMGTLNRQSRIMMEVEAIKHHYRPLLNELLRIL